MQVMFSLGGEGRDLASQSIPKSINGAGVFTCIYITPTEDFQQMDHGLDCLGKENQRKSGLHSNWNLVRYTYRVDRDSYTQVS